MTPQKKAKELIKRFDDFFFMEMPELKEIKSKQCALICADEILDNLKNHNSHNGTVYIYWGEVKQEIEKL